ncbi:MAG: hypothetical protein ACYTEQ_01600 [Planctomycetota bacterium]|jgi:hypothetical protein
MNQELLEAVFCFGVGFASTSFTYYIATLLRLRGRKRLVFTFGAGYALIALILVPAYILTH